MHDHILETLVNTANKQLAHDDETRQKLLNFIWRMESKAQGFDFNSEYKALPETAKAAYNAGMQATAHEQHAGFDHASETVIVGKKLPYEGLATEQQDHAINSARTGDVILGHTESTANRKQQLELLMRERGLGAAGAEALLRMAKNNEQAVPAIGRRIEELSLKATEPKAQSPEQQI